MFTRVLHAVLVLACVACAVVGCARFGRAFEARARVQMLPSDKQGAETELKLDAAQVEALKARIAQLDALKAEYPKLDNDKTAGTIADINADIAWYEQRIKQITAIKDTLPDKPAATTSASPAPTASPSALELKVFDDSGIPRVTLFSEPAPLERVA